MSYLNNDFVYKPVVKKTLDKDNNDKHTRQNKLD